MIIIEPLHAPSAAPMTGALFLDRDGVVNVDLGHVYRIEDVVFVEGIFDLGRAAAQRGLPIVIVTNQSGIARGLYSAKEFRTLSLWMAERFVAEGCSLRLVVGCPHHPDFVKPEQPPHCDCRKPAPGMLLQAIADLAIDPARSVIVGDKQRDMEAGQRAGVTTRLHLLYPGERDAPAATSTIEMLRDAIALLPG